MQGDSHRRGAGSIHAGRRAGDIAMGGARCALALLVLAATSTQAAVLPLRPGTFVLTGVPCRHAAFGALFTYDGRQFSYPHASGCRSVILSQTGRAYRLSETCSTLGDGSPTARVTTITSYKITSPTHLWVGNRNGRASASYRWCRSQ